MTTRYAMLEMKKKTERTQGECAENRSEPIPGLWASIGQRKADARDGYGNPSPQCPCPPSVRQKITLKSRE